MKLLIAAFAILIIFSGLTMVAKPVLAGSFQENFDGYMTGGKPCVPDTFVSPCSSGRYLYEEVGGGSIAIENTVFDAGAGKALGFAASGPNAAFTGGNACDSVSFALATSQNTVQFPQIALTTLGTFSFSGSQPSSSTTYTITFGGTNKNHATLVGQQRVNGVAGATFTAPDLVFAASNPTVNTFYHFTVTCPQTAAAGTAVIYSPEAAQVGPSTSQVSISANAGTTFTANSRIAVLATTVASYLDNLFIDPGAAVIGTPTATISVPGVTGMDVDQTGSTVITREGAAPQHVKTYAGTTLAAGGDITTSCNSRSDGVAAQAGGYVTYADCKDRNNVVTAGSVEMLHIRSSTLGAPVFQSGSQCRQDQDGINIVVPANLKELGRIGTSTWAGENVVHLGSTDLQNQCFLSWTFSTGDGKVGVFTIDDTCTTFCEADGMSQATQQLDPSGTVSQICSWVNNNRVDAQRFLMTAVSGNGPLGVWSIFGGASTTRDSNGDFLPQSTITPTFTPGVSFSGSNSAGCGLDKVLYSSGIFIGSINTTSRATVWSKTLPSGIPARGATLSGDGLFGAYISGQVIHIFNNANGNEVASATEPTCASVVNFKMDYSAQGMWLTCGTPTDTLNYWLIQTATTPAGPVNCFSTSLGSCPNSSQIAQSTTTATGAPGSFFGLNPGAFDPSGQGDLTKGGFFLSLLLILGFAAVGAGLLPTTKVSGMIFGAGLGALLGFAWTVFLGVMPQIITFILIVLGASAIGLKHLASRSGSDA